MVLTKMRDHAPEIVWNKAQLLPLPWMARFAIASEIASGYCGEFSVDDQGHVESSGDMTSFFSIKVEQAKYTIYAYETAAPAGRLIWTTPSAALKEAVLLHLSFDRGFYLNDLMRSMGQVSGYLVPIADHLVGASVSPFNVETISVHGTLTKAVCGFNQMNAPYVPFPMPPVDSEGNRPWEKWVDAIKELKQTLSDKGGIKIDASEAGIKSPPDLSQNVFQYLKDNVAEEVRGSRPSWNSDIFDVYMVKKPEGRTLGASFDPGVAGEPIDLATAELGDIVIAHPDQLLLNNALDGGLPLNTALIQLSQMADQAIDEIMDNLIEQSDVAFTNACRQMDMTLSVTIKGVNYETTVPVYISKQTSITAANAPLGVIHLSYMLSRSSDGVDAAALAANAQRIFEDTVKEIAEDRITFRIEEKGTELQDYLEEKLTTLISYAEEMNTITKGYGWFGLNECNMYETITPSLSAIDFAFEIVDRELKVIVTGLLNEFVVKAQVDLAKSIKADLKAAIGLNEHEFRLIDAGALEGNPYFWRNVGNVTLGILTLGITATPNYAAVPQMCFQGVGLVSLETSIDVAAVNTTSAGLYADGKWGKITHEGVELPTIIQVIAASESAMRGDAWSAVLAGPGLPILQNIDWSFSQLIAMSAVNGCVIPARQALDFGLMNQDVLAALTNALSEYAFFENIPADQRGKFSAFHAELLASVEYEPTPGEARLFITPDMLSYLSPLDNDADKLALLMQFFYN